MRATTCFECAPALFPLLAESPRRAITPDWRSHGRRAATATRPRAARPCEARSRPARTRLVSTASPPLASPRGRVGSTTGGSSPCGATSSPPSAARSTAPTASAPLRRSCQIEPAQRRGPFEAGPQATVRMTRGGPRRSDRPPSAIPTNSPPASARSNAAARNRNSSSPPRGERPKPRRTEISRAVGETIRLSTSRCGETTVRDDGAGRAGPAPKRGRRRAGAANDRAARRASLAALGLAALYFRRRAFADFAVGAIGRFAVQAAPAGRTPRRSREAAVRARAAKPAAGSSQRPQRPRRRLDRTAPADETLLRRGPARIDCVLSPAQRAGRRSACPTRRRHGDAAWSFLA